LIPIARVPPVSSLAQHSRGQQQQQQANQSPSASCKWVALVGYTSGWLRYFSVPEGTLLLEQHPHSSVPEKFHLTLASYNLRELWSTDSKNEGAQSSSSTSAQSQTHTHILILYEGSIVVTILGQSLYTALLQQIRTSTSAASSPSLSISPEEAGKGVTLQKWRLEGQRNTNDVLIIPSHSPSSSSSSIIPHGQAPLWQHDILDLPRSKAQLNYILTGELPQNDSAASSSLAFFGRQANNPHLADIIHNDSSSPSSSSSPSPSSLFGNKDSYDYGHILAIGNNPVLALYPAKQEVSGLRQAVAIASTVATKATQITSSLFSMAKTWWGSR
jgi:hypothetical protein